MGWEATQPACLRTRRDGVVRASAVHGAGVPWGLDRGRRAWAASSVRVLTAASHACLCVTIAKPILLSL